jgi:hypothetical protein
MKKSLYLIPPRLEGKKIGAMAYDRMDAIGFHSIPSFFNIQ